MRESEGVAPEEPLEGDDTCRNDREAYLSQGGLSSCQTRVEKADTGNHEQDQSSGSDHPCDIPGLVKDIQVLGERVTPCGNGAIVRHQRYIVTVGRHDCLGLMVRFPTVVNSPPLISPMFAR